MKTAQNYLSDSVSGEERGGFNARLQGDSFLKTVESIPAGIRWGGRSRGWNYANKMILKGKIFSEMILDQTGVEYGARPKKLVFKCYKDGDAYCCIGEGFVNLQESDNYAFGDTYDEAVDGFKELMLSRYGK